MSRELTLVIMAGGLGSRFGGLKQVEPIDEHNNFIIDYSIFDAIREGFSKVVFIIKREHLEVFKKTIGERIAKFIAVDYAFQGLSDFIPKDLDISMRTKPWGTGHAVLCAGDKVQGDFAVINADDFYGRDGFRVAGQFFRDNMEDNIYGLVGYKAGNTLTENGAVKRGVCKVSGGFLEKVEESTIEKIDGKIYATSLSGKERIIISPDHLVSMNLICFKNNYFDVLKRSFAEFLADKNTNLSKDEFFVLNQVEYAKKYYNVKMKVLETSAIWQGVTYKEDKEGVVLSLKKLREQGVYPNNLWEKRE